MRYSQHARSQLQAFYFQPGTNLPQLLAQQLGLNQQALTFTGASGLRTVFGASGTLRHNISGDGSSLTIANQTELLGHWIVALVLDIERDWTWDGLKKPAPGQKQSPLPQFEFVRDGQKLGVVTLPRVVSPSVTANSSQPPDRSRTRIIFFDCVDGNPAAGEFPETCAVQCCVCPLHHGCAAANQSPDHVAHHHGADADA